MNMHIKQSLSLLLLGLVAPVAFAMRGAQVVSEQPDGALFVRSGSSYPLAVGSMLQDGDVLETRTATVILWFCDGALLTVYPDSVLHLVNVQEGTAQFKLERGEILGDTTAACPIGVRTIIGTTDVTGGVFGVLMYQMGAIGWTQQVRNLDGQVSFTGDPKLDTSNLVVSLVTPQQPFAIPAGEEIIIRGVYNTDTEVFTITVGGATMAALTPDVVDQMQQAATQMREIVVPPVTLPPTAPDVRRVIEIPYEDIEIASNKGLGPPSTIPPQGRP